MDWNALSRSSGLHKPQTPGNLHDIPPHCCTCHRSGSEQPLMLTEHGAEEEEDDCGMAPTRRPRRKQGDLTPQEEAEWQEQCRQWQLQGGDCDSEDESGDEEDQQLQITWDTSAEAGSAQPVDTPSGKASGNDDVGEAVVAAKAAAASAAARVVVAAAAAAAAAEALESSTQGRAGQAAQTLPVYDPSGGGYGKGAAGAGSDDEPLPSLPSGARSQRSERGKGSRLRVEAARDSEMQDPEYANTSG